MTGSKPEANRRHASCIACEHGWLRILGAAFVTFAVWRGSLFLFDLLGASLVPSMGRCRKQWAPFGPDHAFLNGFFRWDSGWYIGIAKRGYSFDENGASSVAFYPLLPYLARYLGFLVGGPAVAALIITNSATIGAIYYLRRIGTLLQGDAVGKVATILFLVFPTSFFLTAFYTEGVFVCLAAASMFHYLRADYVRCGVFGLLAMLTRSTGLALFVALFFDLSWRLYRRELAFHWTMYALLLIPLGLGLFMLIQEVQVGDPLAFAKTMKHWGRRRAWPWEGISYALLHTDYAFAPHFAKTQRFLDAVGALGFLAGGVLMAVKRYPIALWAYVVLGMLMPLSTYALAGMLRYGLALFPVFILVAQVCKERPELERWLVFVSALFLGVYSLRFIQCGFVG